MIWKYWISFNFLYTWYVLMVAPNPKPNQV